MQSRTASRNSSSSPSTSWKEWFECVLVGDGGDLRGEVEVSTPGVEPLPICNGTEDMISPGAASLRERDSPARSAALLAILAINPLDSLE